jgi:hypothetical protein
MLEHVKTLHGVVAGEEINLPEHLKEFMMESMETKSTVGDR